MLFQDITLWTPEKRGMVASQNLLDLCFRKIIFCDRRKCARGVSGKLEACVQTRTVFYRLKSGGENANRGRDSEDVAEGR